MAVRSLSEVPAHPVKHLVGAILQPARPDQVPAAHRRNTIPLRILPL